MTPPTLPRRPRHLLEATGTQSAASAWSGKKHPDVYRGLGAFLAARVRTREYAPGLLLAALLLAIAEALLANRGGRRAVRRAAELPPAAEERAA